MENNFLNEGIHENQLKFNLTRWSSENFGIFRKVTFLEICCNPRFARVAVTTTDVANKYRMTKRISRVDDQCRFRALSRFITLAFVTRSAATVS